MRSRLCRSQWSCACRGVVSATLLLMTTCTLAQTRTVWAWGHNLYGQLGLGYTTPSSPHGVPLPTEVSLGSATTLAAGNLHTLALDASGHVWGWGANWAGQLGLGDTVDRSSPTQVTSLSGRIATALATGSGHAVCRTSDGAVWSWGMNAYGQLGLGDSVNRHVPSELTFFSGETVSALVAGGHRTFALTSDGKLWAWGSNYSGNLGLGDTTDRSTPSEVAFFSGAMLTALAAGSEHTLALTSDGRVWAWGYNGYGELGLGDTANRVTPTEVAFFRGRTVTALVAGGGHSFALTSDGKVWAWGANWAGELGLGDRARRNTPTEVTFFTGKTVTALLAGFAHSLAVTSDGKLWSWGDNIRGQLGLGDTATRTSPVEVALATPFLVAAGYSHSFAIRGDNANPVADPQSLSATPGLGRAITLTASDGDGDPLTYRITSYPAHGSLSGAPPHVTYTSEPAFAGSDSFAFVANDGHADSAPATVSIAVVKADTTLWVADRTGTITEVVTLRQYDLRRTLDAALLSGKPITFMVEGSVVGTSATDAGGDSALDWAIVDGPATRRITAQFAGDAACNPSSDDATLTCRSWTTKMATFNRSARIAGRTELKCRLLRSDNVPLYNRSINFHVDGTFVITRPTNVDGYASYPYYTVPDGAGAGVRTILSEWPGNAGYAEISKVATLTVGKAMPYIWVLPKTIPQGAIAKLYAYFRRLYDYQEQAGRTVDFKINGTVVQTFVTDANGIARYLYPTTEPPGVYTIRCEFYGDAWLDAGHGEASLTLL